MVGSLDVSYVCEGTTNVSGMARNSPFQRINSSSRIVSQIYLTLYVHDVTPAKAGTRFIDPRGMSQLVRISCSRILNDGERAAAGTQKPRGLVCRSRAKYAAYCATAPQNCKITLICCSRSTVWKNSAVIQPIYSQTFSNTFYLFRLSNAIKVINISFTDFVNLFS